MTGEWWDRPSVAGNPRTLTTDLVGIREAMWYLRRPRHEVMTYVVTGRLELVGHRADMFRADDLRDLRAHLSQERSGLPA